MERNLSIKIGSDNFRLILAQRGSGYSFYDYDSYLIKNNSVCINNLYYSMPYLIVKYAEIVNFKIQNQNKGMTCECKTGLTARKIHVFPREMCVCVGAVGKGLCSLHSDNEGMER